MLLLTEPMMACHRKDQTHISAANGKFSSFSGHHFRTLALARWLCSISSSFFYLSLSFWLFGGRDGGDGNLYKGLKVHTSFSPSLYLRASFDFVIYALSVWSLAPCVFKSDTLTFTQQIQSCVVEFTSAARALLQFLWNGTSAHPEYETMLTDKLQKNSKLSKADKVEFAYVYLIARSI